jgi:hypothetical protein
MTLAPRPARALTAVLCAAACVAAAGACGGGGPAPTTATTPASTPARADLGAIRHVFVLVLENENAGTTFGSGSPAPYLAETLRRAGTFVPNYYGIGHHSLANYVALVSGQRPNPVTEADCPVYVDVVRGAGCVYPRPVQTVAGQLEAKGLTWKAYMEDVGLDPARDGGTTCAHPKLGAPDRAQAASPTDQYATRHNPYVYFHSVIDRPACAARDVPLSRLPADLARASDTPNLSYVVPDLCHDGHDATCADGGPGGLPAADAFLRAWVPRITRSPAFRRDGLLVITFDEAADDATGCCGQAQGGGRVGAVLLSPFARPGTMTTRAYDHYGLLRTVEDAFGLAHLGAAGAAGARSFGADALAGAR